MRLIALLIKAFFIILIFSYPVFAANHYIRQGATGANNGNNWTDAWTATPTTWTRGDTYYFAEGSYSGRTLSTAVSGTSVITLKKCPPSTVLVDSCQTVAGWSDSMGDAQATFGPLKITTSYWELNGQTRTTWNSGHGFRIYTTGPSGIFGEGSGISYITVKYIEITSDSMDGGTCKAGIDLKYGSNLGLLFSYNHIHTLRGGFIWIGGSDGAIIEYNYLSKNGSDASCHGNGIADTASDNLTIRYNVFADTEGTGCITALTRDETPRLNENWYIYGNVFFRTEGNPYARGDLDKGIVQVIDKENAVNWYIYNNTIVNLTQKASGVYLNDNIYQSNGVYVYNNLWYNCVGAGLTNFSNCTNCLADYNYYMGATHASEANEQNYVSLDPTLFLNMTARSENFRLTRNTNAGGNLGSLYNVDMDGTIRRADGVWDRGAYEYNNGDIGEPPNPPRNLRILP
jgi:hypothetical protein